MFLFSDLVFILFWWFQGYSSIFCLKNLKTLDGIRVTRQKKSKRSRASRWALWPLLRPSGDAWEVLIYFLSAVMKPQKVSKFPAINIHETRETIKTINETRSLKNAFLRKTFSLNSHGSTPFYDKSLILTIFLCWTTDMTLWFGWVIDHPKYLGIYFEIINPQSSSTL